MQRVVTGSVGIWGYWQAYCADEHGVRRSSSSRSMQSTASVQLVTRLLERPIVGDL